MSKLARAVLKTAATEIWQEARTAVTDSVAELREAAHRYTQGGEDPPASTATEFRYVYREGTSNWYPVARAPKVRPVYIVHRVEFK